MDEGAEVQTRRDARYLEINRGQPLRACIGGVLGRYLRNAIDMSVVEASTGEYLSWVCRKKERGNVT